MKTISAFTFKQRELMASACCYAEFQIDPGIGPTAYWRGVAEEQRKFYRDQAEALIALVRNMPTVKP